MTNPGSTVRPALGERGDSFLDWAQLHSRQLVLGLVGVVAVAGAAALYARSKSMKNERAERAYAEASRAVVSGNLPLAQSDLQKMISRYQGTPASDQASLALAQVLYQQQKYPEGLKALERVGGSSNKGLAAAAHALMGAGYEDEGKYAEAAKHYLQAAEESSLAPDKTNWKANAARAYASAGQKDKAKALWTELATDTESPVAGEARVRLGELGATPAGRS
jgi:tetratricopeptide (TPR) repeat protein